MIFENEIIIYFNESVQEIFKKEKTFITLDCIMFSTYENEEFKVVPSAFYGGKIQTYTGKIKDGKCKFSMFLEFGNINENEIIESGNYCNINITINIKKINFKIKFYKPDTNIFSDDYYLHFNIKGKNEIHEKWNFLKNSEKTKFYVTPFNFSKDEIDYKTITSEIRELKFYYISKDGMITSFPKYEKKFLFKSHYIRANEYQFPIALKYQDLWFPLIKNNIIIQYNIIYFEDWKEIKNQVCLNYKK